MITVENSFLVYDYLSTPKLLRITFLVRTFFFQVNAASDACTYTYVPASSPSDGFYYLGTFICLTRTNIRSILYMKYVLLLLQTAAKIDW